MEPNLDAARPKVMVRLRRISVLAVAVAILAFAPIPAEAACIYLGPGALADAIAGKGELARDFDTVLVGTVTKVGPTLEAIVDDPSAGHGIYTPAHVDVRRVLRGRGITKATFMNLGGTLPGSEAAMFVEDTFRFREGKTYILVAHRNRDATFSTSACTPSKELNAQETARWLGQPVPDLPDEERGGGSRWPWFGAGLGAALAVAGALLLRRRIAAGR